MLNTSTIVSFNINNFAHESLHSPPSSVQNPTFPNYLQHPSLTLSASYLSSPRSVNKTQQPYFDPSLLLNIEAPFSDVEFHNNGDFTIPPKPPDPTFSKTIVKSHDAIKITHPQSQSYSELKQCFTLPPPSKQAHFNSYDVDDELLWFPADAIQSNTAAGASILNIEPYDLGPPKPPITSTMMISTRDLSDNWSLPISMDSKLQICAVTHNLAPSDDIDYEVPPKPPEATSILQSIMVAKKWFSRWKIYVGHRPGMLSTTQQSSYGLNADTVRHGPINNSDIISNGINCDGNDLDIYGTLQEDTYYVLLPQEVWERLLEWYKGGLKMPRKLISQGVGQKQYNIEVYPVCLKVTDARDKNVLIVKLSKKATMSELYELTLLHHSSMSCPHVSGVVGLLKTLQSEWTLADIKSAIMTTTSGMDNSERSIKDCFDENATPFAYGSGHIQLAFALDPRLIYDLEVIDNINPPSKSPSLISCWSEPPIHHHIRKINRKFAYFFAKSRMDFRHEYGVVLLPTGVILEPMVFFLELGDINNGNPVEIEYIVGEHEFEIIEVNYDSERHTPCGQVWIGK